MTKGRWIRERGRCRGSCSTRRSRRGLRGEEPHGEVVKVLAVAVGASPMRMPRGRPRRGRPPPLPTRPRRASAGRRWRGRGRRGGRRRRRRSEVAEAVRPDPLVAHPGELREHPLMSFTEDGRCISRASRRSTRVAVERRPIRAPGSRETLACRRAALAKGWPVASGAALRSFGRCERQSAEAADAPQDRRAPRDRRARLSCTPPPPSRVVPATLRFTKDPDAARAAY